MNIVMTGGTSGFGALAVEELSQQRPMRRVVLGGRSATDPRCLPLDLGSLESVRAFAAQVVDRLDGASIDALVLNAGLIRPDDTGRSADGFETTFAVNHLAHHLLLRLLLPTLADGARIIATTSGTHDPEVGAGLATPRHADADLLAHPDRDPDRDPDPRRAGQHAYTASKLCTVLTVNALAGAEDVRARGIRPIAFDPGQVFGTGLARDLALPLRVAWSVLGTPIGAPLRRLKPELNTRRAAGRALATLIVTDPTPAGAGTYAALRRGRLAWGEPSALARDPQVAAQLWDDSVRLTG
ncbi:SDR family NAD(P)-dependent oxidoreductase [Kribbia dieselivorans]|uniref:SDR family NAD(P)-dependent oxidoreductase n=1 Tax=Kribbia dieselivorans TaxID=331526 RepID=UPI0008383AA1|nr:SDR family NAD(P)-dependent oxidoreductase [Kribbia dieselivorans]